MPSTGTRRAETRTSSPTPTTISRSQRTAGSGDRRCRWGGLRLRLGLAHLVDDEPSGSQPSGFAVIARSFVRDIYRTIPAAEVEASERRWLALAARTRPVPRQLEESSANLGLADPSRRRWRREWPAAEAYRAETFAARTNSNPARPNWPLRVLDLPDERRRCCSRCCSRSTARSSPPPLAHPTAGGVQARQRVRRDVDPPDEQLDLRALGDRDEVRSDASRPHRLAVCHPGPRPDLPRLRGQRLRDDVPQRRTPDRSGFLSAFFALVPTHGLHVTAGCIWIVVMLAQIAVYGTDARIKLDCSSSACSGTSSTSSGSRFFRSSTCRVSSETTRGQYKGVILLKAIAAAACSASRKRRPRSQAGAGTWSRSLHGR